MARYTNGRYTSGTFRRDSRQSFCYLNCGAIKRPRTNLMSCKRDIELLRNSMFNLRETENSLLLFESRAIKWASTNLTRENMTSNY